jgi:hypothetical protein
MGAPVLLLADLFYSAMELMRYVQRVRWQYRILLKSNFSMDSGQSELTTTGELAQEHCECDLLQVTLFAEGVPSAIGILHALGYLELMDHPPWTVRPREQACLITVCARGLNLCSTDLKSRASEVAESHCEHAKRLDKMIIIRALIFPWCVRISWQEQLQCSTSLEKSTGSQTFDDQWSAWKMLCSHLSWFTQSPRQLYQLKLIEATLLT